ncbi:hypothetical protein NDU88_006487 [Pleurodeles waltl]|uniref:Uncharacterized protein n=1 Tax=Pleurodeles waltl TaxID=8319 RepID=A0AAV7UL56_PLEWA|nr:hypothetical protein NDU88_006487 [Pleurodeles waltl]
MRRGRVKPFEMALRRTAEPVRVQWVRRDAQYLITDSEIKGRAEAPTAASFDRPVIIRVPPLTPLPLNERFGGSLFICCSIAVINISCLWGRSALRHNKACCGINEAAGRVNPVRTAGWTGQRGWVRLP